jgi:membrane-bound ClpP family serine protease
MRDLFLYTVVPLVVVLIILTGFYPGLIWLTVLAVAILVLGIYNLVQNKHAILKNFPVIGYLR